MDRIKKLKIKKQDGTFSDYIPIGADAENIDTTDGESVQLKLNKKPYYYTNVASMKADTKLKAGDMAITLGYYEANDGGRAEYQIVNDDTLVDDGGSVHSLANGKKAVLIVSDNGVNVKQFGAYCDANRDDALAIQKCINYAVTNACKKIIFPNSYAAISKEIYIPVGLHIENMHLEPTTNATLLNNYLIYTNTVNGTSWAVRYPQTDTYFKNLYLRNRKNNALIINTCNGIFNYANVFVDGFFTDALNISWNTSTNYYLDTVQLKNINVTYKKGTAYAIQMGYLGDGCLVDTAHIHDTASDSQSNFILIGDAHYPITLNNIINGNISGNNSMINLLNSHLGEGVVTLQNVDIKMENVSFRHIDSPNVLLTKCRGILNNITFRYDLMNISYEETNDIDINISNDESDIIVNNCIKDILLLSDANSHYKSIAKTNLSIPMPFTQKRYTPNYLLNADLGIITGVEGYNVNNLQLTYTLAKWFEESGIYYYRAHIVFDDERKLGVKYTQSANLSLTNGEQGAMYANVIPLQQIKLYRGSATGNYNKYVIVPTACNKLADNGFCVNGYNWIDREAGDIDAYNQTTYCKRISYNNVETKLNAIPIYGKWNAGDIVLNSTLTAGGVYGWICVEGGTPGTWKALGNIAS